MIETRVDGRLVDRLPAEEIAGGRWGEGVLWVDAVDPDGAELDYLVTAFRVHPLAEEDIRHRNQRPKMDEYDGQLFIVVFGATTGETGAIELRELHVLIGERSVLSISDRALPAVVEVGQRCSVRPEMASGTPGQLVYRLVDAAMDSFFPVLDRLEGNIDHLETRILERPDSSVVADIFDLKRDLNMMRRLLGPQRDLLQGLAGVHGPALGREAQLYLRDVYDHAVRVVEEVDSYRDVVTGALDVYLSSVSNRLGEQTRRLSVVATIFLPLTFFTGFFGQNFGFLVEKIDTQMAFIIGVLVELVSVALIWSTVRWLSSRARPVPMPGARRRHRLALRSGARRLGAAVMRQMETPDTGA